MNQSILLRIAVFSFFSIGFFACANEPESSQTDQLLGRWDIREASRNGRPTESLDQLYFEFYQDGKMRTNLTGAPEDASYVVEGKVIKQRDSQIQADYTIEEVSDSTLILSTQINSFSFKFLLGKTIQEI